MLFMVPLFGQNNCQILDLTVSIDQTDPNFCNFKATIDFDHQFTTNQFNLKINGVDYGNYTYTSLPLTVGPINNAGGTGVYNFLVSDVVIPGCADDVTIQVPICNTPCSITDFKAVPDTCTSDSTYSVLINFNTSQTINTQFSVFADGGIFLGTFPISSLPLVVSNFPWSGNAFDVITVCVANSPNCCASDTIAPPNCLPGLPCYISDLTVKPDTCTSDSTYTVQLDFKYTNPATVIDTFDVFVNDSLIGAYATDQLPLSIVNLPWGGKVFDRIRVCLRSKPNCCRVVQIVAPDCLPFGPCMIMSAAIEAGPCTSDSTFNLFVNFQATNPGLGAFVITGSNGQQYGPYQLSEAPVTIANFPWNGLIDDFIKICVVTDTSLAPCCETFKFDAPDCLFPDSCAIYDLVVDPLQCIPGTTGYSLFLNFKVDNPGNNFFEVYAGNGQYLGIYPISQLPVTIPFFPSSGGVNDVIRVCINDNPNCCATLTFQAPSCPQPPCFIDDLKVETGNCTSDSTYEVTVNFQTNAPSTSEFSVFANGVFIGNFPVGSLPLSIDDFPWNGGPVDEIKVCIVAQSPNTPVCCASKAFDVPGCLLPKPCDITDFFVEVIDCTSDSTYRIQIGFDVINPGNATSFGVWANGTFFGTFPLSSLPLTIDSFPWNGGMKDVIKVCLQTINVPPGFDCCVTREFLVPDCLPDPPPGCEITDFEVEAGPCTTDSTYKVKINFWIDNPTSDKFNVYANGAYVGTYLNWQLPITIHYFPWGGGAEDLIEVCVLDTLNSSGFGCCQKIIVEAPDCLQNPPDCKITDLSVQTGPCTSDSTYKVTINFQVSNNQSSTFGVWANGVFLGFSNLSQLPLTIDSFPWNGGSTDHIKVCIVTPGTNNMDCCADKTFLAPDCITDPPCDIESLSVQTGACTSDSTYELYVDFQTTGPAPGNTFAVFANGQLLGYYNLSQLPLKIDNFPWDGGAKDVIKICLGTPNAPFLCCETLEFLVPDCLKDDPCKIVDLHVDTGDCTSDSTYEVVLNFDVLNPGPATEFGLWANGQYLGLFPLSALPLTISDFPWSGNTKDQIKVCIHNSNTGTSCCKEIDFLAPHCLFDPCKIYDLQVQTTPCLCGQFFAVITFSSDNGGPDGFEIVGNGNNYGTFPYNQPQPIILGPFNGDGATPYEFAVVDLDDPDCRDAEDVGVISCSTSTDKPESANGKMTISPNPADARIQVQVQLSGGALIGQADVEILSADGRQVRMATVSNGNYFTLDVAELPSGMYHLVLHSRFGRLEGNFVKQ